MLPNVTGTIIAIGYNCHVRVGTNASDAESIAMVASANYNEDFQAQDAVVIGNLGPISVDPQGYNCTIAVEGFLPSKKLLNGQQQYADGGKRAIMDYVPSRAQFVEAGAMSKIAYMDFYNKKEGKVLAAFEGVLITNNGINIDGNTYVRNSVQMRALSKN
jgi:hypothetical protein